MKPPVPRLPHNNGWSAARPKKRVQTSNTIHTHQCNSDMLISWRFITEETKKLGIFLTLLHRPSLPFIRFNAGVFTQRGLYGKSQIFIVLVRWLSKMLEF